MVKKIAIIVLNWNQPDITIETVSSFLKISSKNFTYHIYLVDNASSDDSFKRFTQEYKGNPKITLLKTKSNLGYVGGNNFAIKKALKKDYDYFLVANNDILLSPDFLQKLFDASKKYPDSVLCPKIYFAPGYEYFKDRYSPKERGKVIWALGGKMDWNNVYGSNIGIDEVDRGQFDQLNFEFDFISGCCLFLPAKIFKKIGLFDPKYFLYMEDVDFSLRAKKHDFKLRLVPSSVIWHLNSASSSPSSNLQNYFITRNRLLIALRYAPLKTKLAIFRESIRFLFLNDYWRRKGVIDFYLGRFGKGSWR